MPGSKQAWPKRAACWSPAMPLMGTPARGESPPEGESGHHGPKRPQEGRTSGSGPAGRRTASHSSADHRRTTMSKSMVREALVASVANTPAVDAAGQVPQHPRVDGAEGQVGAGRDAALPEQPLHLGGREVRVEDQPGPLPDQGEVAGLDHGPAQRPRCGGPARRWPGAADVAGAPVPGHHRLALVGDADGPGHPAVVGQPAGHLVQRGPDHVPDLGRRRARPSPDGGSAGSARGRRRRPPGPARRRPGPGRRWCRRRWRWTPVIGEPPGDCRRAGVERPGDRGPGQASRMLAPSNHLQFFANALSAGIRVPGASPKSKEFVDRGVTTLL